ncbi:ATP-binding cassette domain-containing protein [Enteractinococcus coprophilus]|uniref:Peptide/nickel transport system ATP-binding protein n=1 Tax=Enteractinococcus coprophilus TaxID=1027633 RepID=A0A543ALY7_9MICC|nr:ABC transporter ATP-binding protein [Enteractinococcus coprophilus]TQL73592.1 peptide/nickel transport system ATP-binding protein [Enteractinococcus coprophilus]
MSQAAVEVKNLSVSFPGHGKSVIEAVKNVSFKLTPGKALGIVGESGSGKSVTARALLGLAGGQVTADVLNILGTDARKLPDAQWRELRGGKVAMILQDALNSLDPLRPIHREIADALPLARKARKHAAVEALRRVEMPNPTVRADQRSPQLSGGMRQRALIAQAMIGNPAVVVADEATTALDTRLTRLVLDQLHELTTQGIALAIISHDLAQIAQVADEIIVMRHGEIVEAGLTDQILERPSHDYTKQLLAAVPAGVPRFVPLAREVSQGATPQAGLPRSEASRKATDELAVEVTGLSKTFGDHVAVDDVSLSIGKGATLGLVGESGSGKTTTARMILGLTAPDTGTVHIFGEQFTPAKEIERRALRDRIGAIYQDPLASFDPRYSVSQILINALSQGTTSRARQYRKRAEELLETVELDSSVLSRYPRELSGGQRQRLAIARALAPEPDILILDEPVSALDVSVQATVLDLLDRIQLETATSYLFITHDLAVVEHMSDTIAVMTNGQLVETGIAEQILNHPRHTYTQELMAAAPTWGINRAS